MSKNIQQVMLTIGVVAALAMASVALVLAMRDGPSQPASSLDVSSHVDDRAGVFEFVPKGSIEVDIIDFAYNPDPVRVRIGGPAVAWTNFDAAAHTVTAADGSWGSGVISKGETFAMFFDTPGVYRYICTLHPPQASRFFGAEDGDVLAGGGGRGMEAIIIVE